MVTCRRLCAVAAIPLLAATGFAAVSAATSVAADSDGVPGVATAAPPGTGVDTLRMAPSGNLRKQLGERAGLTAAGENRAFFEITVEAVSVLDSCPGRGVDVPPEYGRFIVLDVEASMAADLPAGVPSDRFMPLGADAFTVADPAGRVHAATLTPASWGCFPADELAAPFVGAGETTRGKVVLDSPIGAGVVVYAPGGTGWEWEFGR